MFDLPLWVLALILVLLICASAFFSSSETSMMSLNRYRLRHLARSNRSARQASQLLKRPDRLLGVILIGNNFANILASALATTIAVYFFGELGILLASVSLTIVILIFAEVSPKTVAVLYPERIAFPASWVLGGLLYALHPMVSLVNTFSNGFLKLFGITTPKDRLDPLNKDELKTVVQETTGRIPSKHKSMLLNILDLDKVTVDDIMIPKNEIIGIDLENSWKAITGQLANSQHTFLPVFRQNLNKVVGLLHSRTVLNLLASDHFNEQGLINGLDPIYFVPEGTPLATQLINFQKEKKRIAFVVNEYGDLQGLITLEDILEEIVGEFTTDMAATSKEIHPQKDGSFLVDGSIALRELNRAIECNFSSEQSKTLSGLIIEYLENIPTPGTCLKLGPYSIEVIQVFDNRVKTVRIVLLTQ